MAYYLGIDAGGTKTSFLLVEDTGAVVAAYRGRGCRLLHHTKDELIAIMRDGLSRVCGQAGIAPDAVAFAGVGISGYGESAAGERETLQALETVLGPGKVVCDCDCHVAWAGSLAMAPGINIISGTGANCYGVNAKGERARSNGWGSLFDEGSCHWIGIRLVQCYTRQADGRMPRTLLYERFRRRFGIQDDMHFIEPLNHGFFDSASETAMLQRFCKELYDEGDACAQGLYEEAARELALSVKAVAKRLAFEPGYVVSYSGGLFTSGEAILLPLGREIAALGAVLAAPLCTPEQGAVLMAMRLMEVDVRLDRFFQ